jgi:hypothetical protein
MYSSLAAVAIGFLASPLLALGEDCTAPSSLWDKHSCGISGDKVKFQTLCQPQRIFPGGANSYANLKPGSVNGIIVLYHGYTACPDSVGAVAAKLQSDGYVVLAPLTTGHGVNRGFGCSEANVCVNDDNPSFLPTTKKGYIDFVDWSLKMLSQEASLIPASARSASFFIGTGGLSVGGALATLSASRPNTPVQKSVLVNPFYTVSIPGLDFKLLQCQGDSNPDQCLFGANKNYVDAVNTILQPNYGNLTLLVNIASAISPELKSILQPTVLSAANVVKTYPVIMNTIWKTFDGIAESPDLMENSLLNSPYPWGPSCIQVNKERGGYCTTKARNFFAIHNFGSFAISQSKNIPTSTKIHLLISERDGFSRDGLASTLVSKLQANGNIASKCTFLLNCSLLNLRLDNNGI